MSEKNREKHSKNLNNGSFFSLNDVHVSDFDIVRTMDNKMSSQ